MFDQASVYVIGYTYIQNAVGFIGYDVNIHYKQLLHSKFKDVILSGAPRYYNG